MKESFEQEFSVLRKMGPETFVLRGSTLIVELQEPEEIKTKGGLVLASSSDQQKGGTTAAHRVEVGKVLMSGQGWHVDAIQHVNGSWDPAKTEPLECQPGAIVILPQFSTQAMSHFPGIQRPTGNKLVMVKMDQILAYFPSEEAYNAAKAKLNG